MKSENWRNQGFLKTIFCLIIEGSGAGFAPLVCLDNVCLTKFDTLLGLDFLYRPFSRDHLFSLVLPFLIGYFFLFFFVYSSFYLFLCGRPGTRQWRRAWTGSPSRTPPACPSPRTTGRTSAPSTMITSSASTTSPPRSSPRWTATADRRRVRPCPHAKSFWS
jgi:hypothetical protein